MTSDTTTYVAVHDQDTVIQLVDNKVFSHMSNVVYLFLGPRPVDKVLSLPLIRCVDYLPDVPNLYDFAGFDVLAGSNLLRTKYSVFLQYDHRQESLTAEVDLEKLLERDLGMVAFVPAGYDPNNWMLMVPDFKEDFHLGLRSCGVEGDWSTLDCPWWPTTQGHAWRSSYFYTFINWARPAFAAVGNKPYAGHLVERLLTVFCARTHPPQVQAGLFIHDSADCHGTGALMGGHTDIFRLKASEFGR